MDQPDFDGEGMDARAAQDALIEEALVGGLRYSEVAQFARCSVRTVRRRMEDEGFARRVAQRRAERTAQQSARLAEAGWTAIEVLFQTMGHPDPAVRLRGAQMALTLGSRYRRDVEFNDRIEILEKRLGSLPEADGREEGGE